MINQNSQGPKPLAGIKVLDMSKILAGPYLTMMLADLGAEVIKVEHPDAGDPTRLWGPPFVGDDATYYLAINRGKQSVTIDLKSEEGQTTIHDMLEECDVVVENFRPGSGLQKTFDYKRLSEQYPHLVILHISAFGDEGPLRDEPGYDIVAQAAGGLMSLTGEPDGPPMKAGWAMGDLGAGMFGAISLLAALYERTQTGRGQYVTTSLYEGQLAMHVNWATNYFAKGERPHALGSAHANLAPYQAFPSSDDYFVIAVGNDAQWVRLCLAIDRSDLAEREEFAYNRGRLTNLASMQEELSRTFLTNTAQHWIATLKAAGVPVTPIKHLDEVYADPHTEAIGMIKTVPHHTGPLKQIAFPASFNGRRPDMTTPPPRHGEHTNEILQEFRRAIR